MRYSYTVIDPVTGKRYEMGVCDYHEVLSMVSLLNSTYATEGFVRRMEHERKAQVIKTIVD